MSLLKRYIYKIVLTIYAFFAPVITFAQGVESGQPTTSTLVKLDNPINAGTINVLIKDFLQGVVKLGMPVIALAVIYCGFLFVQARGKPEAITKAKDALLYTLIGAAILLGSYAIAELIASTVLSL